MQLREGKWKVGEGAQKKENGCEPSCAGIEFNGRMYNQKQIIVSARHGDGNRVVKAHPPPLRLIYDQGLSLIRHK